MTGQPAVEVSHWHAHVYFGAETLARAESLCRAAAEHLPVRMGRVHQREVGPHPRWSCQLSFAPADLGAVVTWLTLHRNGLTVFVHPNTGDELADHRDRAVWLGDSVPLKLEVFTP